MPDITEYYTTGGSALSADEVDDEREYVVTGCREKVWDDGTKTLYLKFADEEKELRCNVTNMKRIAEMYGTNTDGWIGKPLMLLPDVVPTGTYKGKPTIIVRVKKTRRNAPATGKRAFDEVNPPPPFDDEVPF